MRKRKTKSKRLLWTGLLVKVHLFIMTWKFLDWVDTQSENKKWRVQTGDSVGWVDFFTR